MVVRLRGRVWQCLKWVLGAGVSLSNLMKRLCLLEGGGGGEAVDSPGTGDGE